MIRAGFVICTALLLAGCAQNPQQAAAMRQLGAAFMADPAPVYASPANLSTPRNMQCHNLGGMIQCNQY